MISKNLRIGQYIANVLDIESPDLFYTEDEKLREIVGRFGWLRFVEDGDLARLEQWAAFWNDGSTWAEAMDYEISKPIQAELARRAQAQADKEGGG